MPKIRATDFNIQTGNVSSVTVVMPEHATGDVLLVFAGKDDATGSDPTTATSGWLVGGSGVSGGATTAAVRAGWFIKRATSAAEPDLVITSSDADTWSIIAMAIRGAGPSKTITNASWAASVSTFTITAHGYTTGAIVQIEGVTPSGYNGIYKVASTPTADTFTVADSVDPGAYTSGGTSYCIVDNHTGNGNTDATGAPYSVTGVTTNYDKSMAVFACLTGGTGCPVHYPGLVGVGNVDSAAEGLGVAYTIQRTAGATGSKDFYTNAVNSNQISFCVAVRDDGTGYEAPYWDTDYATLIHPFRGSATIITSDVWGTALTNYPTAGKDAVAACFQVDQSGGPSFVDYTTAANNSTDADVVPYPATEVAGAEGTGDWFAIGHAKPFNSLLFDRSGCTQGVAGVVAWEYWNGSAWAALSSVTDATTSFTSALADGQEVRWAFPPNFNWAARTLNGSASLFYVRARCTTLWTTNPTISQVYVGGRSLIYDAVGASADAGVIQFEDASNITATSSAVQAGGVFIDLGQTVNLASKIICGTYMFILPRDYVDSAQYKEGGGVHVWFADTSFNRKAWCVGSYLDTQMSGDKRNRFAIDWEQSTDTTHSRTTTDPSDTIADVGIANLAPRGAGGVFFSHMMAVDPTNAVLNGGSSTVPITFAEFLLMGDASPVQLFRDAELMIPVTFGGSGSMHYALDAFTIEFPGIATAPDDIYNRAPRSAAHYDSGVLGFRLDARSGDTLKLTNGKISSDSTWKFDILATASASATWDFTGLLLVNANVTLRAVHTFAGMTFQNCPTFTQNSAVIDGCTFSGTKITSNNPGLIDNCDFTSAGTGHAIEITATGTFTMSGDTYSGYGADGSTDAAIYNNSGGAVTINVDGGGDIPTVRNGAGASTTVESPVSTTITVIDAVTGSAISGARVLVTASDNTGPMPFQETVTSITRSGSTATVNHTAHGLVDGKKVMIKGANEKEYNGVYTLTRIDANSYSYTVSGTPATPATGTVKATGVVIDGTTNGSGIATDSRTHATDQPITGRVRKATGGTLYKTGAVAGTVDSATGFSTTVQMIPDQ